jgi:hypothetical protein
MSGGGVGSSSGVYTIGSSGNVSVNVNTTNSSYGAVGQMLNSVGWNSISPTSSQLSLTGTNINVAGKEINLLEMYETMMTLSRALNIIPRDQKLLDSNPTLADAYEQYEKILIEKMSDARIKEAYDQYQTLKALSTEEESNDH